MNCKRCQKLLYEFLDGALSSTARASVEAHLETCDACRQALVQEQLLSRSVPELVRRETASLSVRPNVQRKILEALESGARLPRIRLRLARLLLRPALALGTAACLLVAAILAVKKPEPETAPPAAQHVKSYIMCMATTYTDETKTDWIERRLIVETRNGGEGYLRIIARKTPKTDQTKQ
jgi:anti-sigma factor RsiW